MDSGDEAEEMDITIALLCLFELGIGFLWLLGFEKWDLRHGCVDVCSLTWVLGLYFDRSVVCTLMVWVC